jgi:hypothetical protein
MATDPAGITTQIAAARQDDPSAGPLPLIEDYEAGPALLRAAVAGMTAEELRTRPVAGKWSSLEVLCHVSDCEQYFADRMKRTPAMDRPLLVGADGWLYPGSVRPLPRPRLRGGTRPGRPHPPPGGPRPEARPRRGVGADHRPHRPTETGLVTGIVYRRMALALSWSA